MTKSSREEIINHRHVRVAEERRKASVLVARGEIRLQWAVSSQPRKNTTPQSKQELRAAKQTNCRIQAWELPCRTTKTARESEPGRRTEPVTRSASRGGKTQRQQGKIADKRTGEQGAVLCGGRTKDQVHAHPEMEQDEQKSSTLTENKAENYRFWHGRLNPVERKSICRKQNRKCLESSRSGTDASTENKNSFQIDAKIETEVKWPAAEESCARSLKRSR
jgi:hypothetical protein